jgi:BTB/POZ domain
LIDFQTEFLIQNQRQLTQKKVPKMPIDSVPPTDLSDKSDFESGATFKPPNQETSIITRDPLPSQQQFCLRWNNYQTNLTFVFDQLLQTESFCDVTLACDKASIKAHKMVLSACSPYFQALFFDNPCQHPIIIMKDVKWHELKAIVEFMYKGEINVGQDQIGGLLKLAEMLKIRGLADVNGEGETAEAKTPGGSVLKTESERATPRSSADFDVAGAETSAPAAKSRKRRWSVGEGSDVDSPIDESNLETIDAAASPIPPAAATAIGNPPKTPTQIPPYPPPALDNMNLSALSINQPEDLEIKPGIAEMIREEERVSVNFLLT